MSQDILEILQITDAHLFKSETERLEGMPCNESFRDVLALALSLYSNPDLIVFSGDISQDYTQASYDYFFSLTRSLPGKKVVIPGNHDNKALLEQGCHQHGMSYCGLTDFPHWQFICLDSTLAEKVYGYLSSQTLQQLQDKLATLANKPTGIIIHHPPPIEPKNSWLQGLNLTNADDLWACLNKSKLPIRFILCGHIHQEMRVNINNIDVLTTPSTCIQFKINSNEFALDKQNPGFRYLRLHPDGQFETKVIRITGKEYPVNLSSKGY